LPSSSSPPVIFEEGKTSKNDSSANAGFTSERSPPEKASPYIIRDVGLIGETAGNRSL
jgi:hypothetical protein